MKVSVLGSGSFGTAIANVLGDKGYNVFLYARRKELVDPINEIHENVEYLKGFKLSENIFGTTDLEYSLKDTALIVLAIPTQQLSKFVRDNLNLFPDNVPIVCVAKGIEENTLRLVSEILEEELPGRYHKNLCYLSGPSFAKEIVQRFPTLVSIASRKRRSSKKGSELFLYFVFSHLLA
jgi:glycerol-3-phosphate dehydrogenase (NAD(P)+)